jgi:hypothetical protein
MKFATFNINKRLANLIAWLKELSLRLVGLWVVLVGIRLLDSPRDARQSHRDDSSKTLVLYRFHATSIGMVS